MSQPSRALSEALPLGGVSAPFGTFERMIAARYLRANRRQGGVGLISIISFVGIMLAVAVLIITMSVMNGFRQELLSRILGFDGHVFIDTRGAPGLLVEDMTRAARATAQVVSAYPVVEGQVLAAASDRTSGAFVRGYSRADMEALEFVSGNIVDGSLAGFGDGNAGGNRILVGSRLAVSLGLMAGDTITLIAPEGAATPFGVAPRRKSYTIGGIFNVGAKDFDGGFIFMPIEQSRLFFNKGDGADRIEVRVTDPDNTLPVLIGLRQALGMQTIIFDWKAQNSQFVTALVVERNVMRLLLMMIVAIAALNIISGLVMLVKNKTKDIAILRTMGASRGSILRIFMLAGMSVGVLGALAGVALGVLVCTYIDPIQAFISWATRTDVFSGDVYMLTNLPAKMEIGEVLSVTGWALAMSLLATLAPSWRAARLDPVEALRYG
jgi:lipoprotein-releasing system permease protein